jgi:hypothetical protein
MPQRKRLLIDIDPLRVYGNSSDVEKEAALRQAQAIEQYLHELGWPEPMLCDSGNGYHLLYAIDLPSQESEDLVRRVLLALAKKFDNAETHVDTGVFESNRVAKFPDSWARKAPATPERPHRQALIVQCPEDRRPVSRDLLESVAAEYAPENRTLEIPANDQLKIEWLRGFLEHYNVPILRERRNGQRYFTDVECPWLEEHHSPSGDTTSSVGYERGWG